MTYQIREGNIMTQDQYERVLTSRSFQKNWGEFSNGIYFEKKLEDWGMRVHGFENYPNKRGRKPLLNGTIVIT